MPAVVTSTGRLEPAGQFFTMAHDGHSTDEGEAVATCGQPLDVVGLGQVMVTSYPNPEPNPDPGPNLTLTLTLTLTLNRTQTRTLTLTRTRLASTAPSTSATYISRPPRT